MKKINRDGPFICIFIGIKLLFYNIIENFKYGKISNDI